MRLINSNLQAVRERIRKASKTAGRNAADIKLLAVSKTRPAEDLLDAIQAGQLAFGESYAQEAIDKIKAVNAALSATPAPIDNPSETGDTGAASLQWHFIGSVQSNKTRDVALHFDWVHSVDRLRIARRLSEQRPPDLAPLQVCLQVNISEEASKGGCHPDETADLCLAISRLPRLQLRGLMAIPSTAQVMDPATAGRPFAMLAALWEKIRAQQPACFDTLSMGMSHDLEAAISEGATIVRIGTAIFGHRQGKNTNSD